MTLVLRHWSIYIKLFLLTKQKKKHLYLFISFIFMLLFYCFWGVFCCFLYVFPCLSLILYQWWTLAVSYMGMIITTLSRSSQKGTTVLNLMFNVWNMLTSVNFLLVCLTEKCPFSVRMLETLLVHTVLTSLAMGQKNRSKPAPVFSSPVRMNGPGPGPAAGETHVTQIQETNHQLLNCLWFNIRWFNLKTRVIKNVRIFIMNEFDSRIVA